MKKISFRNDILPMKDILFRLAMRITLSREEAEDIVQDTLIKVWNRRDSWDTLESVEAFSLTICRNLALDRMRLRDIEGKTYKEIAAVLDITEDQVKVNIFRARQTIKQQFQKYDNYGL